MTTGGPTQNDVEEAFARELASMGLSSEALARAIGRAKLKTRIRAQQQAMAPPSSRPRLDTNPELDSWFD